jgi:hypothetical protein
MGIVCLLKLFVTNNVLGEPALLQRERPISYIYGVYKIHIQVSYHIRYDIHIQLLYMSNTVASYLL